jgi:hypothetical protein
MSQHTMINVVETYMNANPEFASACESFFRERFVKDLKEKMLLCATVPSPPPAHTPASKPKAKTDRNSSESFYDRLWVGKKFVGKKTDFIRWYLTRFGISRDALYLEVKLDIIEAAKKAGIPNMTTSDIGCFKTQEADRIAKLSVLEQAKAGGRVRLRRLVN